MIVQTKKEAWEVAKKIVGTDYYKDENFSYYAGYPIYVSDTSETDDQIADLGIRLEVRLKCNAVDCKTTNIWIAEQIGEGITEEMEQEALKISNTIVLKHSNKKFASNEVHKNIIFQIAAQALKKAKSANSTQELFDICDEAENLLAEEIEECNSHLTIYEPLTRVIIEWRKQGKVYQEKYDCMNVQKQTKQQTVSEIEKKMGMIAEQFAIIANDFEKYAEDIREEGAFIYDTPEEYVNKTFAVMQFMDMTRDFMKKGIKIINDIYKEVE